MTAWLYSCRLGERISQRKGTAAYSYQQRLAKQTGVNLSGRLNHGCPPKLLTAQKTEEGDEVLKSEGLMEGRREEWGKMVITPGLTGEKKKGENTTRPEQKSV